MQTVIDLFTSLGPMGWVLMLMILAGAALAVRETE